jgi:hypothetical protein
MTQRKLALKFKTIVTLLIATQLATGSQLSFAANGSSNSNSASTEEERQAAPLLSLAFELDRSQEGELPKETVDTFLLAHQRLEVFQGKGDLRTSRLYELSAINLDLPSVLPPNFDRDVRAQIDPETRLLTLDLLRDGNIVARQHLPESLKVAAVARDKELLVILSTTGELYAMDMGYARAQIFKGPMPIVRLVQTGVSTSAKGGIQAQFISRGVKPVEINATSADGIYPLDRPLSNGSIVKAGDLLLYTEDASGRRAKGLFDRDVIKTQLYTAEAVIAMLAYQLSPPADAPVVLERLALFLKDAELRTQAANLSGQLSPLMKDALTAIPEAALNKLLDRAGNNASDLKHDRDRMTVQEWSQFFRALRERALRAVESDERMDEAKREQLRTAIRRGEFGADWREILELVGASEKSVQEASIPRALFHRVMTSRSMKLMAMIAGGGALMAAADISLFGGAGGVWAVYLAGKAFRDYAPDVLKDEVYRITLLKSTLALSAFVPLMSAIGHLYSKATGLNWPSRKALAAMGLKVYGTLMLPFYHHVARLARQPNFLEAWKRGMPALQTVRADSNLGRSIGLDRDVRVGVNNPFLRGQEHQDALSRSSKARSAVVIQRQRIQALAGTLALLVASEQSNLDPATLASLLENKDTAFTRQQLEKLAKSPEFRKTWVKYAREINLNLLRLQRGEYMPELDEVPLEQIAKFYEMAKGVAARAQNRIPALELFHDAWIKGRAAPSYLRQSVANFGTAEYEFLKAIEPSNFVVSEFWAQFVTDYLLAVGQVAVVGDRARMDKPDDLAASEKSFLWTTGGHRYDMMDQVRIYGVDVPARLALVYQRTKPVVENAYDPIEQLSLVGTRTKEGVATGLVTWFGGALNVNRADYGSIFMRDLVSKLRTVQAAAVMGITARVLGGGQHIADAIPAFIVTLFAADWTYRYVWKPVNRGNQVYGEKLDERERILMNAKTELARGLRTGDTHATLSGTKKLVSLYSTEDATEPIADLAVSIEQAEKMFASTSPEAIAEYQREFRETTDVMQALQTALSSGDETAIAGAKAKLLELYRQADPANAVARLNLSALELLEYALKTPPFATAQRSGLTWTTTLTGALITTYLGTTLLVDNFQKNIDWSERFISVGWKTAAFYIGVVVGQRAIDRLAEAWRGSRMEEFVKNKFELIAEQWKQAKTSFRPQKAQEAPVIIRSCNALFGGF